MAEAGTGDIAIAVQTMLAFMLDKQADLGNSLCAWEPVAECPRHLFGRQAIGIVWDFAEGVVTGDSSGGWSVQVDRAVHVLEAVGAAWNVGTTEQASATKHPLPNDSVSAFITDPPYYDAVPYADLSDFFYVWLRRSVGELYPTLFRDALSPKQDEAVQLAERNPIYAYKTKEHFEAKMMEALSEGRRVTVPSGIGVIVFAHKATAAWETMLKAVIDAGWVVYASWPIDTEMGSRLRAMDSATLSSSVHLVCRPRENADGSVRTAEIGDWRGVLAELPRRMHDWMPRLAEEGVVGADAIFACLGPALEIFSRYSRVEKSSGEVVTLKEYLEQVWAAVAKEALSTILKDTDSGSLEPDARLTVMWLWTLGGGKSAEPTAEAAGQDNVDESDDEEDDAKAARAGGFILEYDAARKIAQGLGAKLEDLQGTIEIKGDKACLLPVSERASVLFGKVDAAEGPRKRAKKKQTNMFGDIAAVAEKEGWGDVAAPKTAKTTLDRIHQAMLLFAAGRGEALKRFIVEDGAGKQPQFWKLAQSLAALYPAGTDERRWIEGVLARKKQLGF